MIILVMCDMNSTFPIILVIKTTIIILLSTLWFTKYSNNNTNSVCIKNM